MKGGTLLVLTMLLLLLLGGFGCGKKGPPVPPADRAQVVAGFPVDTSSTTVVHLTRVVSVQQKQRDPLHDTKTHLPA
jgi:predicted small lipoprotein YifL